MAIYTLNKPTKEVQNVAYSLDDGTTYKEFENNPVLDLQGPNFRDPKPKPVPVVSLWPVGLRRKCNGRRLIALSWSRTCKPIR